MRFYADPTLSPIGVAEAESSDGETAEYRFTIDLTKAGPGQSWVFRTFGVSSGRLTRPAMSAMPLLRDPDAVSRAVARPWKFAFDNSWRTGALAVPGRPIRWAVRDPATRARLETGIVSAGAPLGWRILAEGPAGGLHRLASGEIPEGRGRVWVPVRIDLSVRSFRALRFEVESKAPGAWGAWSEPLLLKQTAAPPRPDVFLIVADTVRADQLSPYGASPRRTPFLSAMAADRAALFEHAVSPATWTFPAHVSLLTGLEAFRHGAFSAQDSEVLPALPSLAVLLRRAGYRTLAVTADGLVHPQLGFSRGFDRYFYFDYKHDAEGELGHDVNLALAQLRGLSGQPVFLFFHTYEAHVPNRDVVESAGPLSTRAPGVEILGRAGDLHAKNGFYGDPGFLIRDLASGRDRPATRNDAALVTRLYDEALEHLDSEVARLVAGLYKQGRWRHAAFALTADHGESLGWHDRMSHTWLDEADLRVPLLVGWPDGYAAGHRVKGLVSLVDVMPTLLDAVGVKPPPGLDGRSLRTIVSDPSAGRSIAWSYVAANNHGLAMIRPDARKLLLLDSAWRNSPARVRLVDPARDAEERGSAPGPKGLGAEMERAARQILRAELPGLRIRVTNGSASPIGLVLRQPALGPVGTKSPLGGAELEWRGPGRAATRLARGEIGEWILIDAPPGRVDLEGKVTGLGAKAVHWPIAIHVSVPSPGKPVRYALDLRNGRWRRGAATPFEVEFELTWRGSSETRATAGDRDSRELERALRALGYLN